MESTLSTNEQYHADNALRYLIIMERISRSIVPPPSDEIYNQEFAKFNQDEDTKALRLGLGMKPDDETVQNYLDIADKLCKEKDIDHLISSSDHRGAVRLSLVAQTAFYAYLGFLDHTIDQDRLAKIKEQLFRRSNPEYEKLSPDSKDQLPVERAISEVEDHALSLFVDDYYRNNDGDFIFRLKTVVDDNMPHNDANKPNDSWVTAEEVAKMEEVDLEY